LFGINQIVGHAFSVTVTLNTLAGHLT
jgi:hypothetical protein